MIKWLGMVIAIQLTAFSSVLSDEGHQHSHGTEQGKTISLQGEVLDMACYMAHEGKGSKHANCAQKCLDDGSPAGLLTDDGNVYLLVEDHGKPKAYQSVKKMAGQKVNVSGKTYSRGGIQAMALVQADPVK